MKLVCKSNEPGGYYSKITPGKEYGIIQQIIQDKLHEDMYKEYYIIINDMGEKGLYLKKFFYTLEETRSIQLDKIIS